MTPTLIADMVLLSGSWIGRLSNIVGLGKIKKIDAFLFFVKFLIFFVLTVVGSVPRTVLHKEEKIKVI